MKLSDVLTLPSLKGAHLLSGEDNLQNEVTGVMVLEAPDIEVWGKAGQVILSSFYALKDLDPIKLKEFLDKLTTIGISALVIKLDRLVPEIPEEIVRYCQLHSLPLIRLSGSARYESIIQEILEPLFKENARLLGNNSMYELLHSPSHRAKDLLHSLSIDRYPLYQLMIVRFCKNDLSTAKDNEKLHTLFEDILRQSASGRSRAYLLEGNRLIVLFNLRSPGIPLSVRNLDLSLCHIAFSSIQKAADIPECLPLLLKEAEETLRIEALFYPPGTILSHDDLGLYHYLLSAGSLSELEKLIPSWLLSLRQENEALADTLFSFVENEKNYARTAEVMHLHPKSVKYRMEKILESTGIDLTNSETLLQIMIAYRILRLLEERSR